MQGHALPAWPCTSVLVTTLRACFRSTWQGALEVHGTAPAGGATHTDSQPRLKAFLRVFTYSVELTTTRAM